MPRTTVVLIIAMGLATVTIDAGGSRETTVHSVGTQVATELPTPGGPNKYSRTRWPPVVP